MSKEWWDLPGIPKPVYIATKPKHGDLLKILSVVFGMLLAIIALAINAFSPKLAILIGGILFIVQGVSSIISSLSHKPSEIEYRFARSLLKELKDKIVSWSIPAVNILIAARLSNGSFLYFYIARPRKSQILIARPCVYGKIMSTGRLKVCLVRDLDKTGLKEIDAVLPLPDNPRIWYRMLLRGVVIDQKKADVKNIASLITRI